MIQQRLQHWIEHPEELGTESLYELRQLLVQYPFFQTARILYLKNLYLLRDPSFKDELRKGALFVADLSILFYAIEGDKFVINRHVAEKENVSSETSDRTLDLIDRFLADDKDLSVEKLFPLPVEAVDYTSVLMEKEENTEPASVNPLRGQDLIDHFIEQAAREEAEGVEPIKEAALLGRRLFLIQKKKSLIRKKGKIILRKLWLKFMLNSNAMIKRWSEICQ